MSSRPQTVLVTGGAGYVGSVFVRLLLRSGLRVRVIDNLTFGGEALLGVLGDPCFDFVHADIRRPPAVAAALDGVDAVVHLAAIVGDPACRRQPDLAKQINGEASELLLEQAIKSGVRRFVFASTCSNYGRSRNGSVCTEDSPLKPVSLYAELKVAFEQRLLGYATPDLAAVCLRFATAYGLSPRPRFDLTVNEFTRDLCFRKPLEIYGEQFWRPYCHTTDLAAACHLALMAPDEAVSGRAFNVGHTDENYRKRDLAELILTELPDRADLIAYIHREEDPRDYRVDCSRIHDSLGFIPRRRVIDGIREIIAAINQGIISEPESPRYRNV